LRVCGRWKTTSLRSSLIMDESLSPGGICPMRISIPYGSQNLDVELPHIEPVEIQRAPASPVLADPLSALRESLESPQDFPALRLALTPGDHVALAVDRFFAEHREYWLPVLEHVASAGVQASSMTMVLPHDAPAGANSSLPPPWTAVQLLQHDPL